MNNVGIFSDLWIPNTSDQSKKDSCNQSLALESEVEKRQKLECSNLRKDQNFVHGRVKLTIFQRDCSTTIQSPCLSFFLDPSTLALAFHNAPQRRCNCFGLIWGSKDL
ncbi:hypothetical protein ACFE04_022625 [Oxalis oulophora]